MQRESKFSFIESIKNFNFLTFCKNNSPREELLYAGFGIFCMISTICTMYYMSGIPEEREKKALLYIYESMLILSVFFITLPIWPTPLKKDAVIQVAWNIGILYLLIICSTFFLMLSNFGSLAVIVFTVNLVVVAILTRWRIAVGAVIIGLYLGTQFYKYYTGASVEGLNLEAKSSSLILYALLLIGTAIVIFLKPKQEYQEVTEEKNDHLNGRINAQEEELHKALRIKEEFIRNVQHEYHAPMTGVVSLAQALLANYKAMPLERIGEYLEDIYKSAVRIDSYDSNINMLSKLSNDDYELHLRPADLSSLVHNRLGVCRKLYTKNKDDREFVIDIEKNITSNIDREYFTKLLDNLIINAISYCKEGKIIVTLKRNNESISFSIEDEGIGIPAADIERIFDNFVVSSKTWTPAGVRGIGLTLCKRVVRLHGGTIKAESDGIKGSVFKLSLPSN